METYLKMIDYVKQWLIDHGVKLVYVDVLKMIAVFIAIAVLALLVNWIVKRIFLFIIHQVAKKSRNVFNEIMIGKKVFQRLAHLAPAILVYYLITLPLGSFPRFLDFLQRITGTYITIVCLTACLAFVNAVEAFFQTLPTSKSHSIKGYLQVLKIVLYSGTIFAIFSILFGIDSIKIFSLLGASVALLIFIFKDTILGLVASIQLSVNDMLRPGDWIEVPGQKADGIVQDISLTTVKIQNWDHTFTTVPIYSLVSNSFTNWRGMEESEGRRVKRSVNIDMKSVKFISRDLIEKLSENKIVREALDVTMHHKGMISDDQVTSVTNLEIFRAYMENYLRKVPAIHPGMLCIVHYLQPTEFGLPLEIVFFTRDKEYYSFERLQCELLDHIFAVIPEFELRIFQL